MVKAEGRALAPLLLFSLPAIRPDDPLVDRRLSLFVRGIVRGPSDAA